MSLKIQFIHAHLDFFPENCGAVSDEHGERFYQDITVMKKRYAGKWRHAVLAEYYCTVTRGTPELSYKRKAKRKRSTLDSLHARLLTDLCYNTGCKNVGNNRNTF
jgi:hypothetical protein